MKCPRQNSFHNDDPFPNEFSEFNDVCQDCSNFNVCRNNQNKIPSGDNHPNLDPTIALNREKVEEIGRERYEIIEKALFEGLGKITKDDIIDEMIDLELYNSKCRKEKIKRQYKQRTRKDDNV